MSRNDNSNRNDDDLDKRERSFHTNRNRARRQRRKRAKQRTQNNENEENRVVAPNRARININAGRGRISWGARGKSRARKYESHRNKKNDKEELKYTDEGIDDSKMIIKREEEKEVDLSVEQLQSLFLDENKIADHVSALHYNRDKYIEQLQLFIKYEVMNKISTSTKAKILCALLIRNERATVEWLMSHDRYYSVGEIAKCILLLDAPRKARQFRRKLDKLLIMKNKNNKSVKDKTMSSLRTKIHNLELDPHSGSLNGAKCRLFKKWIEKIPCNRLEFFLLNFPTANWKSICDLIHPSPTKHFQCKYFQEAVFCSKNDDLLISENNEKLPLDSLVYRAKRVNKENIVELLQKYPYLCACYSYLRKKLLVFNDEEKNNIESKVSCITNLGFNRHEALCALQRHHLNIEAAAEWLFDEGNKDLCANIEASTYYQYDYNKKLKEAIPAEAKHILSENAPIEDILWWFNELHSVEVEMEIYQRLQESIEEKKRIFNKNSARSNYGKLMERLLLFRELKYKFVEPLTYHAQLCLDENIKFNVDSSINCAVLGDASGSMEVAIKSSCIIASLLSVALNADLKFFASNVFDPPVIPRNVAQTIKVINAISAAGGTNMASAIYPYLAKKIKIDLFILVSDEGENEKYNGQYFSQIFKKYKTNINPEVQLFLVSFLNVEDEGIILKRLQKQLSSNACKCVKQFRLHPNNPDTSKFNALLGMCAITIAKMKQNLDLLTKIITHQFYNGDKYNAKIVANCICSYL